MSATDLCKLFDLSGDELNDVLAGADYPARLPHGEHLTK